MEILISIKNVKERQDFIDTKASKAYVFYQKIPFSGT